MGTTRPTHEPPPPRREPDEGDIMKLNASPEEIARRIFANVEPPDPSKRIIKKRRRRRSAKV